MVSCGWGVVVVVGFRVRGRVRRLGGCGLGVAGMGVCFCWLGKGYWNWDWNESKAAGLLRFGGEGYVDVLSCGQGGWSGIMAKSRMVSAVESYDIRGRGLGRMGDAWASK
jgi:hypothetical protein